MGHSRLSGLSQKLAFDNTALDRASSGFVPSICIWLLSGRSAGGDRGTYIDVHWPVGRPANALDNAGARPPNRQSTIIVSPIQMRQTIQR